MMSPGLPDLWAVFPSSIVNPDQAVWIEVKSAKGRMSAAQQQFQAECVSAQIGHVVGGLDAVVYWLRRNGRLR
jgi:hypothetical protein